MTRRPARATVAVVLVLGPLLLTPASAHGTSGRVAATPVRHLVVMTQDEHSFDNYLGSRRGVDGLGAAVCQPATVRGRAVCLLPRALTSRGPRPSLNPSAAAERVSVAGGRMTGFVAAQTTPRVDGSLALGYYRPASVPVLTQLADHGVVFDRWFASVPGGGIANRLFAMSAHAVPDTPSVPAAGWPDVPVVFDRLQAAGVSWKVYVENYEPALTVSTAGPTALRGGQVARVPLLAMARYENSPALMSHITDLNAYYADLAAGRLPAVSWIVTTAATERPPAVPSVGQRAVRNVVNALGESSAWGSSAFVLSYDSSGGWYDHVPPPARQGATLGLRVPALLVSPYATPRRVDHAQLDGAAVLRFIETNWGLRPLTARDATAGDLSTAFAFDRPPHPAVIVGTTPTARPSAHLHRVVIVVGYLLAVAVAVGSVGWAVGARRPAPDEVRRAPAPDEVRAEAT